MPRITVTLNKTERDALVQLAEHERRDPRAQAALIIRRALARRKLLKAAPPPAQAQALPPVPSGELPDWLRSSGEVGPVANDAPPSCEDLPDWLKAMPDGVKDDPH